MIPAESNADAAITGSSDLPPPGVTAAKMSVTSLGLAGKRSRERWRRSGLGGCGGGGAEMTNSEAPGGVAGRVSVFFEAL